MGETAVPALIKVLASKDTGSLKTRNALDAYMSIYREDVDKGIRTLKQAPEKETDLQAVATLDGLDRFRDTFQPIRPKVPTTA